VAGRQSGESLLLQARQVERAVGDHDLNTLRLRLDPQGDASWLQSGKTVWIAR
jgi:HlyD family secretion protein